MLPLSITGPAAELDELTQWQLAVARRADELLRHDAGRSTGRNHWHEAEQEIWARAHPSAGAHRTERNDAVA